MNAHTVSVLIGAHELKFETGRLAKIAAGSCLVTYGDTMVLAAVSAFPLRVTLLRLLRLPPLPKLPPSLKLRRTAVALAEAGRRTFS